MVAAAPSSRAASATAWAWLPEEKATTPRARSSGERRVRREKAPRALKAPTRWKISALKKTRAPTRSSTRREVRTGVRWTCGRMRSRAARTSAGETDREVVGVIRRNLPDVRLLLQPEPEPERVVPLLVDLLPSVLRQQVHVPGAQVEERDPPPLLDPGELDRNEHVAAPGEPGRSAGHLVLRIREGLADQVLGHGAQAGRARFGDVRSATVQVHVQVAHPMGV